MKYSTQLGKIFVVAVLIVAVSVGCTDKKSKEDVGDSGNNETNISATDESGDGSGSTEAEDTQGEQDNNKTDDGTKGDYKKQSEDSGKQGEAKESDKIVSDDLGINEDLQTALDNIGVDTDQFSSKSTGKDGMNILGDAKPMQSFKSLGLAEDAFHDYLGLHNRVISIDYNLTRIFIVDGTILTGVFEPADYLLDQIEGNFKDNVMTVKMSKVETMDTLLEPYNFNGGTDIPEYTGYLNGATYNMYDIRPEGTPHVEYQFNLAEFIMGDKKYVVHFKNTLDLDEFDILLDDLTWNVSTMDPWGINN